MLLKYLEAINHKNVILASASQNRKKMLEILKIKFNVIVSNFEENIPKQNITPQQYVKLTSQQKLLNVIDHVKINQIPADIIISADTIISANGKIYEKSQNHQEAFQMISELNGKTHQCLTSVWIALLTNGNSFLQHNFINETDVTFCDLTDEEIMDYVNTGEYINKAGSYGIQGLAGAVLVKSIKGCYYNVWGFPLNQFASEMKEIIISNSEFFS